MKPMRFTLAAVVASLLLASLGASRAARGAEPIAHWKFDEGSGTQVSDAANGFHGTQTNCTWFTSGVCNGSLEILANGNGSGIVSSISRDFDNTIGSAFTVSCWVRWKGTHTGNTYSPSSYVLDARDYASASEQGGFIVMILETGHVAFDLLNPRRRLESTRSVPVNDWCHIAAVFDNGTMKLYINGIPAGTRSNAGSYVRTTQPAAIGNNHWAAPSGDNQHAPLNGRIDDLRVYAAALSQAELLQVVVQCLVHLDLVIVGSGSVAVSGELEAGTRLFTVSSTASLTATADAGECFIRWQGDGSASGTTWNVSMTGNMRVIAGFTALGLTLGTEGNVAGTIGVGYPTDYPTGCTRFVPGDVARLTPTSTSGHFCAWSGDTATRTSPLDLPMTGNRSVSALFCPNLQYGLVTRAIGAGSISRVPNNACYIAATPVTLQATPTSPWLFREWGGDFTTAAGENATVVMNGDKAVTARFGGYVLSTSVVGMGGVTREPDEVEYAPGSTVLLTAQPETQWGFFEWTGDASGNAHNLSLTMDGDKSVAATFQIGFAGAPSPAAGLLLGPATPNPSSRGTTLRFELPRASRVTLAIHDVAGRVVRLAFAGTLRGAGPQAWTWDGRDDAGNSVRPGLYFVHLATDEAALTGKLVRLD